MTHSSPRYHNAPDRQEWIARALRTIGYLSIGEISREFGISAMTVRRDLQQLERAGIVRPVYGGVCLASTKLTNRNHFNGGEATAEERIGRCAATLAGAGDAIAIDAGRLGHEVARALPDDFHGTVVTHSISVIQLLASRARPPRVVGLGGEVMPDLLAFLGATTVEAIAGVRVRTLFLTADAVDNRGAYAHSDLEAAVKRALIGIADRIVLLAGHECFADSAPLLLGPLGQFDTVVTDRPPPRGGEPALRQVGVRTLVAQGAAEIASPSNGGRSASGAGQGSARSNGSHVRPEETSDDS